MAETKMRGKNIRIEDNLGEAIHIHLGELRVSLSINEFMLVSDKIMEGANELLKTNNLSLDMFDVSALDWGWLERYTQISDIRKTYVMLKDLYTKGDLEGCPGADQVIPLTESRLVKALHGDKELFSSYREENLYRQTNESRLMDVLARIKTAGYPFDNKYIMINQYNQIYDGDHRAACLMHLYGGEKTIPVIQICFSGEKTLEEQRECERLTIQQYKRELKIKMIEKKQWSEEPNVLDCSFREFAEALTGQKIAYFVIDYSVESQNGDLIADKVVVIQQEKMIELCRAFHISYFGSSYYRYYKFLYSMQRGICVKLADASIVVFDRLCCKSMFENAFIPLDKSAQMFAWNEAVYDKGSHLYMAGDMTKLLFVLVNGMFHKNRFDNKDIMFIQKYADILNNEEFKHMLQLVFFDYTDELIELLVQNKYELVVGRYVKNTSY